jgi:hypothetical protein
MISTNAMRILQGLAVLLAIASVSTLGAQGPAAGVQRKTLQLADHQRVLYGQWIPNDLGSKRPHPLVVALHPGGEKTPYYGAEYLEGIFLRGLRELQPIMIAPDCPTRAWTDPQADEAVMALIDKIRREYPIDSRRILVVGFSLGGQGTWFMESRHSNLFTAGIVMAGSTGEPLEGLGRIPTYIIHSRADHAVPFAQAEERATALLSLGRPVKFEAIDGVGHFDMPAYVPALQRAASWVMERWGTTQTRGSAGAGWKVPRLPDGKPDLQGVWDYKTITPLDRPQDVANQKLLTDEQFALSEKRARDAEARFDDPPAPGDPGTYNAAFRDRGFTALDRRTSLIEDPPDGKMPPLQPGAIVQPGSTVVDIPAAPPIRYRVGGGAGMDGPELRSLAERCLLGSNNGPPMDPGAVNNNVQLVQTHDHVVLVSEMIHEARIVPLEDRAHLAKDIRQWLGDSRGHWEGDTLVIDTTNFTDKTPAFERANVRSARNDPALTALGIGRNLHLIERFARVADDVLMYEYTVDDPLTFTRPFTVKLPMRRLTGDHAQMFEYACHEGNHALHDMLAGARYQEKRAAARPAAGQ